MPSKPETAARRLVAELGAASKGRLWWWCGRHEITQRARVDADAVDYAVQQEWVQLSPGPDPHSITLTEAGRRLAK